jgi:hypothetical protein
MEAFKPGLTSLTLCIDTVSTTLELIPCELTFKTDYGERATIGTACFVLNTQMPGYAKAPSALALSSHPNPINEVGFPARFVN